MTVELSFRDVSYPGFFEGFSCDVQAGSSTLIVTSREAESSMLTRLITGLSLPSHGSVVLGNQELSGLEPDQLYELRQQIVIVPSNGGLISNLKAWENITLPLIYHSGRVSAEEEELALGYLTRLDYAGNIMALPAHLSLHEKRITAFVRALLTRPRLIIYSNCFDGEQPSHLKMFADLATEVHASDDNRTSLYLSSSADLAADLSVDTIIHVHEPAESDSRNA